MKHHFVSNEDYELLEMIIMSSQKKLHKILYKMLKRQYSNIINTSDYLMAQGDIPIGLVAHMDTVFKLPPEEIYFDRQKNVLWSPDGLGADDRAGVFLILKILQFVRKGKKPTVIFTTDEEIGCVGSCKLTEEIPKNPWPLKYLIQLDRRGHNDCVFYDDLNEKFQKYVEKFGFKTNWGSLSDISILCPAWEISGVNLSVGYEDEHHEIETLHIHHTYRTLDRVLAMLNDVNNAEFYKYEGCPGLGLWWKTPYGYPLEDDDDDWSFNWSSTTHCPACQKSISKVTSIRAKDCYGNVHYYCGECAPKILTWCEKCGEPFIPNMTKQKLCCDCLMKTWDTGGNSVEI